MLKFRGYRGSVRTSIWNNTKTCTQILYMLWYVAMCTVYTTQYHKISSFWARCPSLDLCNIYIIQDQTHAIVEMVETRHCGTRGWRTAKVAIGLCFSKHCVRDLDDGGKTSWTILEVAALGEKLEVLIND